MRIGFGAPVSGSWATTSTLTHVARRADELGYHSLWTFQRLLYAADGSWDAVYHSVHDPIVTIGYLAGVTERIRLGIAVVNLPFYSPALLAKQLGTADVLSGGRLDAGLGMGWSAEEYAATDAVKEDRGKRADEAIPLIRTLWTDEVVDHDGEFFRVPRSRMEPKPVQSGGPPILLGGAAPAALRRAGRLADGWISSSRADLTAIGDAVRTVRSAAADVGRNADALRMICRGSVKVRPAGLADRPMLTGSVAEIRGDFDRLAEQGITELFVDLNFDPEIGSPDADPAESLRRADEALDAFAP